MAHELAVEVDAVAHVVLCGRGEAGAYAAVGKGQCKLLGQVGRIEDEFHRRASLSAMSSLTVSASEGDRRGSLTRAGFSAWYALTSSTSSCQS